jgi:hypothetical protein
VDGDRQASAVSQEHDVEHQEFDDLSRALVTPGTRRGAVGALAGLLGASLLGANEAEGKSKQRRRRERRRNAQRRRQNRRNATGTWRGIKIALDNPFARGEAASVEFGYSFTGPNNACCQGEAAYTLQPGEGKVYTTNEMEGYLWVDNRFMIALQNPRLGLPFLRASVDGADFIYRGCCKPGGQPVYGATEFEVEQTVVVALDGHKFSVFRSEDQPDYKVFNIRML